MVENKQAGLSSVLIVEDDIVSALDLEQRVESYGFQVCGLVSDGRTAMEIAAEQNPDLVLVDIALHGEPDGIETAHGIRSILGIPVVFITTFADDERLKRANLTMPFGYILRPFQDRNLRITLEMAVYVARADARRLEYENELTRIKDQWERTFDAVSDLIMIIDHDHRVVKLNRAARQALKIGREEAVGQKCYHLLHHCDQPPDICPHAQVLTEKKEYRTTYREPHLDAYFSMISTPMYDDEGQVSGMVHVLRDVTELKRSAAALQASEVMLASIVRASPIGIGLAAGRVFMWVNDRVCEMTGYGRDELLNNALSLLSPDGDPGKWWGSAEDPIIKNRENLSVEHHWRRKDGALIEVLLSYTSLDLADMTKGIIFTALDITERKKAEHELSASRDTLVTVLENLESNIHIVDMQTHEILFVNRHLAESFGRDLVGERCYEAFRGQHHPCEYCTNNQLLGPDQQPAGVMIWDDRNPITGRWYMNYDQAIRWVDGRFVRLQVAMDVTNIKEVERDRKKLEARLRQTQKMEAMGTLAGGIAHDFNNILGAIVGYTELTMLDLDVTTKAYKNLNQALNAAERAKDLVKQILTFSRQTEKELNPVDVGPIIKEALKFLRSSLPSTIEIRPDIQNDAGATLADPTEIHQIMMNLCSNAAYAMRNTGGILEVKLDEIYLDGGELYQLPGLKPGHHLRVMVSDTGEGVDREILERVFEPYFTTKNQGEGTGLGLALVHGIVKNYGGLIQVYSDQDRGTTFYLYLPVARRAIPRETVPERVMPVGSETIMLVDDEKDILDVGRQSLERLGYQVEGYADSRQALAAFQLHPDRYHLVVTDQTMPHLTGADLAGEVMKTRPDIPVILCTGFSETITAEKAEKIGIRAFLMKPLIIQKLATVIRSILDRQPENTPLH